MLMRWGKSAVTELQERPCDFNRHQPEDGTCECRICGWHLGESGCPDGRPLASGYMG